MIFIFIDTTMKFLMIYNLRLVSKKLIIQNVFLDFSIIKRTRKITYTVYADPPNPNYFVGFGSELNRGSGSDARFVQLVNLQSYTKRL